MAKPQQNVKFTFGYLNNRQDAVDLKKIEGTVVSNLDPDDLGLGTLKICDIFPVANPTVLTTASLGGRSFRLSSGVLEFLADSVTGGASDWRAVNAGTYPPQGAVPTVSATSGATLTPTVGSITGIEYRANPGYSGPSSRSYGISINVGATDYTWTYDGIIGSSAVTIALDVWQNLRDGIQVKIPSSYTPVAGHTSSLAVTTDTLPADGVYTYLTVTVLSTGVKPAQSIEGLPSIRATLTLANYDGTGARVSNSIPLVTFPAITPGATKSEIWLYRKGPDDTDFVRLATYNGTNVTPDNGDSAYAGNTYEDDGLTSTLINLRILQSEKDEGVAAINTAIGNTATTFSRLFEKDNRLWLVPTTRPDLLLYSRSGDWWGWSREQAFGFNATTTDVEIVRDPTTVGGEYTSVVFTNNGIFHITGNGTENSPYLLVPAVKGINVVANSVENVNGTLMFMSESSAGGYDEGEYGQKIYEYDLQKLTEVSARVKNSSLLSGAAPSVFALKRGGDKYVLSNTAATSVLLYHRDSQGWMEATTAGETACSWVWTSKLFTPDIRAAFKIDSARFFKMDYIGSITLTFTVYGLDFASPVTKSITYTSATRETVRNRLPQIQGEKWKFSLAAQAASTLLYDFWFVQ